MRNNSPVPVRCALCGSTSGFNEEECWVRHGIHGQLYALCTLCLRHRHPSVETGPNGQAVFVGAATLADLEERVDRLEKGGRFAIGEKP